MRTVIAFVALLALVAFFALRLDATKDKLKAANALADQYAAKITFMADEQKRVAKIDDDYQRKLSDASKEIDSLRDAVNAGAKRVRVKTVTVNQCSATGSMGDAGAAELTSTARQDYIRLREMISLQDKQIRYLQDYIRGLPQ